MSKNLLTILAVVFVALLLIVSFSVWRERTGFSIQKSFDDALGFHNFTIGNTDSISITKQDEKTKLFIKTDAGWLVNGTSTSDEKMREFFTSLSQLSVGSLTSKNPKNHAQFSVTEETGYFISLKQNAHIKTYILGNRGLGFDSFYAREKNTPEVYLLSGTLRSIVARSPAYWHTRNEEVNEQTVDSTD